MATYVIFTDGISKYSTDYVPSGIAYSAQQNIGTPLRISTLGPLAQTANDIITNSSTPQNNAIINQDGYTTPKRTYYSQTGVSAGNTKILIPFDSIANNGTAGFAFVDTCGNEVKIIYDVFTLFDPPFSEANQLRTGKFGKAWLMRPADTTSIMRVTDSTEFFLNTGNFTIHFQLALPVTNVGGMNLYINLSIGGMNIVFHPFNFDFLVITAYNNNTSAQYVIDLGTSIHPSTTDFVHYAIQRIGSILCVAVNGVLKGSVDVGSVDLGPNYSYINTKYPVDIYANFSSGTPDSNVLIDEYVFVKGEALWPAFPFTPPTAASTLSGAPVMGNNIIGAVESEPLAINPPFVVGGSDFAFEIDVKLHYLYEWLTYYDGTPNTQLQYYGIVGQFTQDADGNQVAGGDYWSLYLRVNTDKTIDAIFEVYDSGTIVTQLIHSVDITWGELAGIVQANADDEYLHLAVARKDNVGRLFVGGTYSDEAGATGALVNFSSISGDIQINGPSGYNSTLQLVSPVSVKSFRMHEEAYYWADYIWEEWDENPGICVYPRIGINIMSGKAGDIRVISGLGI